MKAALLALLPVAMAFASDIVRPESIGSQDVQLRLMTPLASYSRPGMAFSARLIGPVTFEQRPLLPRGTVVHGVVRSAHGIGLGVRRERTALQLTFNSCELPWGEEIACEVQLLTVDNARETVRSGNRIEGVLAASHPQSWMSGMWLKPAEAIQQRRIIGLTGTVGALQSRMAPTPIGAGVMLASRLALFRMPEAHIQLPRGADLIARITATAAPEMREPLAFEPPPLRAAAELDHLPAEITRPSGKPVQDILNLAFDGSREDVERAFTAAGWSAAEALTPRTFARTWNAAQKMESYPTAPVSLLHWQGRPPDLVFQRSLNSLARRHHIRIWRINDNLWVGAATHDVEIGFRFHKMSFTHKIDPRIDLERSKVLNDLTAAGVIAGASLIHRPGLVTADANSVPNSGIETDAELALVRLRAPGAPPPEPPAPMRPPREFFLTKGLRRMTLETRHYLTRGNYFYWAWRSARWGWTNTLSKSGNEHE